MFAEISPVAWKISAVAHMNFVVAGQLSFVVNVIACQTMFPTVTGHANILSTNVKSTRLENFTQLYQ